MGLRTKRKTFHAKSKACGRMPVIGTFDEDTDVLGYALTIRRQYAEMEEGHHAAMRRFLQHAYSAFLQFRDDPAEFERLKDDEFWSSSRQKPKDRRVSKWALYFIMQATTRNVRNRAGKFAVILDGFAQMHVPVREVAQRIKALGGVEAAYEAMRARQRGDAMDPSAEKSDEESKRGSLAAAEHGADDHDEIAQGENDSDSLPEWARPSNHEDTRQREQSLQRSIDLNHSLVVELPDADLDRILNAVGLGERPARFRLDVIVRSPDERGWTPVVGHRVTRIVAIPRTSLASENTRSPTANVASTLKKKRPFRRKLGRRLSSSIN